MVPLFSFLISFLFPKSCEHLQTIQARQSLATMRSSATFWKGRGRRAEGPKTPVILLYIYILHILVDAWIGHTCSVFLFIGNKTQAKDSIVSIFVFVFVFLSFCCLVTIVTCTFTDNLSLFMALSYIYTYPSIYKIQNIASVYKLREWMISEQVLFET